MEKNEKVEGSEPKNHFVMHLSVGISGEIGFQIEVAEGERGPGSLELIGLLEMVKSDIAAGVGNNEPQREMVQVTLVQEDFELPQAEQLVAWGKKVGDTVEMPKEIAMSREVILAQMANGTFDPESLKKPISEIVAEAAEEVTIEKEN